jgi:hypothetical protein
LSVSRNLKIISYVKVGNIHFRLNWIRRRLAYNAGCNMGADSGVSETSETQIPPPLPPYLGGLFFKNKKFVSML